MQSKDPLHLDRPGATSGSSHHAFAAPQKAQRERLDTPNKTLSARDPSTPQAGSLRSPSCSAQDDSLSGFPSPRRSLATRYSFLLQILFLVLQIIPRIPHDRFPIPFLQLPPKFPR